LGIDVGCEIVRGQRTEDKYSSVGAAFPDLSLSKVSRDLAISTIYRLPFTVYDFNAFNESTNSLIL
jgi:hypothetical protein